MSCEASGIGEAVAVLERDARSRGSARDVPAALMDQVIGAEKRPRGVVSAAR